MGRERDPWGESSPSPRVVVTVAPLASFVQNVGGDRVSVVCLCTTQGPHHFEYNIQDSLLLPGRPFLSIGLELDEAFADKLQQHSQNTQIHHVKLGERLSPKLLLETRPCPRARRRSRGRAREGHHHHGAYDPHVWLGIEQAVAMVELIRDELKRVDAAPRRGLRRQRRQVR